MPEAHVPSSVPIVIAAAIAGVRPARLREQYLNTGLVAVVREPGGFPRVDTASLERAIGREILCRDILAAEEARQAERKRAREAARQDRIEQ